MAPTVHPGATQPTPPAAARRNPTTARPNPPAQRSAHQPAPSSPAHSAPPNSNSLHLSQEARQNHNPDLSVGRVVGGLHSAFGASLGTSGQASSTDHAPTSNLRNQLAAESRWLPALQRLQNLRAAHGFPEVQQQNIRAMENMSDNEARMFAAVVGHLETMGSARANDPARGQRFLSNVAHSAAQIAGTDGREMVNLMHRSLNAPGQGPFLNGLRSVAGGAYRPEGSPLEDTERRLLGNNPQQGFNRLLQEAPGENGNTIGHHLVENMFIGATRGQLYGQVAAYEWEEVEANYHNGADLIHGRMPHSTPSLPDVVNGDFGGMIGDALNHNRISPQVAARMIDYYTRPGTHWPHDFDINHYVQQMGQQ